MVRLADHDDDSVHQMRVATRRIRSVLRAYRRRFEPEAAAAVDGELRWLAAVLGEVRDLEVLHARFRMRLAELAEADQSPRWLRDVAQQEARARDRLRAGLLTPRYFALLDALEYFVAHTPIP
jgi:CHAD domain-containing protein